MPAPSRTPRIVIGLGSGRCGTTSLAALLDQQESSRVSHECFGSDLPAEGGLPFVEALLARAAASGRDLFGDVAFGWLWYVDALLERCPDVRLICLQREREATVASLERWSGPRHHWLEHDGLQWQCDPWDHCFRKYPADGKRAAVERYYDSYYADAAAWQRSRPETLRIFPMEILNSEAGQRELLVFAGCRPGALRLDVGLRRNPMEQARHLTA